MIPAVDDIMRYEEGEMTYDEELRLFAGLIESGVAWQLQGHYGRTASALIDQGIITEGGDIVA